MRSARSGSAGAPARARAAPRSPGRPRPALPSGGGRAIAVRRPRLSSLDPCFGPRILPGSAGRRGSVTVGTIASVVFAATTIVLTLLWLGERRRARLLAAGEARRVTQIGELERGVREARAAAGEAREHLQRSDAAHRQLVHDRDTARAWARRLRGELSHAQSAAGTLGDPGDPCELVLRVAVQLLDAGKGALLSRDDADGDGNLDVVATLGFEEEPAENPLVQRIARQTLSAQETLRVDEGAGEIENLVAIPVYIQDR